MTHWVDNLATLPQWAASGPCRRTRQVTESPGWYKSSVKTKERKTNNRALFCGSLLQNNMEVEAAIKLARHLSESHETGLHRVRTGFDQTWSGLVGSYHSNRTLLVCSKFVQSLDQVYIVCAKFAQCLATNRGFSWEKNPVGKHTNLHQTLNKPDSF